MGGGGGEEGTIQGWDIPIGDRDKQKRSFALNQINIQHRHHSQTLDNINKVRQLIQAAGGLLTLHSTCTLLSQTHQTVIQTLLCNSVSLVLLWTFIPLPAPQISSSQTLTFEEQ